MTTQLQSLDLRVSGATAATLPLVGTPTDKRWGTILKAGAPYSWDVPATGTLPNPPALVPTGGPVTLSPGELKLGVAIFDSEDPYLGPIEATATCSPVPGTPAVAVIPGSPIASGPVVTKVAGSGFAGIGGVAVVSGTRLTGVTSVKVGTRAATFVQSGSSLIVIAPAQAAGTYPVTVTTRSGTSAPSTAARFVYKKLF